MKTNFPIYWDEKRAIEFFANTGEEEWEEEFSKTKLERAKFIKGLFPNKPSKTSIVAHIKGAQISSPEEPKKILDFSSEEEMRKYFKKTLGSKKFTQLKLFGQLSQELQERFIELYADEESIAPASGLVFKSKN